MRARWPMVAALAVVGGCRGARKEPPATPTVDDAGPAVGRDDRALTRWRELAPTAATWEEAIEAVHADERRPLARAFLRGGNVACKAVEVRHECGVDRPVWLDLAPTAGFDDPCLRRLLVPWALAQLEGDDAREIEPLLTEMVRMRAPEEALQQPAFDAAIDDAMRLRLLAALADDDERAEALAPGLETDEARVVALETLHLEAVLVDLDPATHRARRLGALADPGVTAGTRQALLEQYTADLGGDVTAALQATAAAVDCGLAASAADTLTLRGDPSFLPARPLSLGPLAHIRALCRLQVSGLDDTETRWRAWLPTSVVVVTDQESLGEDGMESSVSTEKVPVADLELPEELGTGDWHCKRLSCWMQGWPNDLTIDFARAGHTLRIRRLVWKKYQGDDC